MNIHFKSSHISSNVQFTNEEMKFVEMIEKLETPDDVIKVSKIVAKYCNIEKEEKNRKINKLILMITILKKLILMILSDEEKENNRTTSL